MVFENFDLVTVGVMDERGGDRPVLEPLRRRDRLYSRVDTTLIEALAIVGAQVELPEGVPVIDWALVIVVPGELDPIAVVSGKHHLGHVRDLDSMGDLEPEHFLVEVHGLFEIDDVDAVLVDARFHRLRVSVIRGRLRDCPVKLDERIGETGGFLGPGVLLDCGRVALDDAGAANPDLDCLRND